MKYVLLTVSVPDHAYPCVCVIPLGPPYLAFLAKCRAAYAAANAVLGGRDPWGVEVLDSTHRFVRSHHLTDELPPEAAALAAAIDDWDEVAPLVLDDPLGLVRAALKDVEDANDSECYSVVACDREFFFRAKVGGDNSEMETADLPYALIDWL